MSAAGARSSTTRQVGRGSVSAVSSSPVPSGLGQLARAPSPRPLPDAVCLAHFLAGLPDPRDRRGRRFPLTAIVTAAAASVLARTGSLTTIAEWTADAPRRVLLALGFAFDSGRREEREPRTHPHSPPRRSARSPPENATAGQAEILGSAASSPTGSPPRTSPRSTGSSAPAARTASCAATT
jgi:hypothetical protein